MRTPSRVPYAMTAALALGLGLGSGGGGLAAAPRAGADLIGTQGTRVVTEADTLVEIARRHGLGFVELRAANPGIDPWLPPPGHRLVLPTAHVLPEAPREGVVVNLAEQRLYYFPPGGGAAESYPVGIGRQGWRTPLGRTKVVRKRANPTWYPPASIRAESPELPAAVPPGPHNPLGAFALNLGWDGYVIHGTNKPGGIGRRVSHGCIRLYPEDIERLFENVPVGTPVTFVDQPIKLGWWQGELYLEAHPTQPQADEIEVQGTFPAEGTPAELPWKVVRAAGDEADRLDWSVIDRVVAERRGVPVRVTR